MNAIKNFIWLVAILMVAMPSCKDKEDVYDSSDYYYYLDIQSEVRLNLKEVDESQGTMSNSDFDLLSKTVLFMQQAVQRNKSMKGDNRVKEAALLTTLDSLYRNYTDKNPASKGFLICYVKLVRCSLYPNGSIKDMLPIKYFNFWYEIPEGNGSDGGSSSENYLAKPETLEAVDLGLSVLWANCNIGSDHPRNYGARLAWGEPTGKLWTGEGIGRNDNGYTWDTNEYGGNNPPTDIAGTALDIVTLNWGEGWHIPTYDQAKELCEQCQWKLRTFGDLKWYEVIGPNGNSIIMPLAGLYGDNEYYSNRFKAGPYNVGERGYYWTSTSCTTLGPGEQRGYDVNEGVVTAWIFRFNSNDGDNLTPMLIDHLRAFHMSIRPVHDK